MRVCPCVRVRVCSAGEVDETSQGGGRGAQVAQVSAQASGGRIAQLYIEIDLGYGRRINVI